jgi:hypothetical protein
VSSPCAIARAGSPVRLLRDAQARPTVFPVTPEFSNWRSEQLAWRTSVAPLDQSHHMTDLFISGPDALRLLTDVGVNREWLPAARAGSLAGSVTSENIENFYVTPYDLGYGRSVAFDHDFIGRAALEQHAAAPQRLKVTLVWNPEDVAAAMRTLFEPGIPAKYIDLPKARYGQHQVDRVVSGGADVGVSHDVGHITNEHAFVSLASIQTAFAEPGTEVEVVWGEEPNSHKPAVEPHRQLTIRATMQPAPYSAYARENYRKSCGSAGCDRRSSRHPSHLLLRRMPETATDAAPGRSGDLAQGADHAEQVVAHRALGRVGVARHDRVDDRGVLEHRHLRPLRARRELELVTDALRVQPAEHGRSGGVVAEHPYALVEQLVQPRVLHEVALGDGVDHALAKTAELVDLLVGDGCRRLGGTETFDADAHLEDLDRLVHRDRPDARPLVGEPLDQTLVRELEQGRAHRGAARAERVAEVGLDQALVGGVLTAHDRAADDVGHPFFGGIHARAGVFDDRRHRVSFGSTGPPARKIQPLLSTI